MLQGSILFGALSSALSYFFSDPQCITVYFLDPILFKSGNFFDSGPSPGPEGRETLGWSRAKGRNKKDPLASCQLSQQNCRVFTDPLAKWLLPPSRIYFVHNFRGFRNGTVEQSSSHHGGKEERKFGSGTRDNTKDMPSRDLLPSATPHLIFPEKWGPKNFRTTQNTVKIWVPSFEYMSLLDGHYVQIIIVGILIIPI
jgi:hypothetical protein